MQREIQLTADGSHTISIPGMKMTYHSHHGAIAESIHVYINAGLLPLITPPGRNPLTILEIGFGTGLNALLSLQEAVRNKQLIQYTAVELFPLTQAEFSQLNYGALLAMREEFLQIHISPWSKPVNLNPFFSLDKRNISLLNLSGIDPVNLIYFDAFSPTHQPELWTQAIFENLYRLLLPGGVMVTYCSKSEIRRNMVAAGFKVEKIPGPYGKREMVRARK
jgi:tRNA U34 5-methylaminomethyl-2-thiouridine-forming methyltransferase MnmC